MLFIYMSISSLDLINQTTLVPNSLLGYSSNGVSALEINPTSITIAGNLTTTPVYVSISTTGLTTTNPNGLDINCDLDMNSNDITNVGTIFGNLNGQIQVQNTSGNTTHYLTFVDTNSTGLKTIQATNGLSFNPHTNILTTTSFNGSLTGNASSSSTITLTSDNTNGTYYIPFSKLNGGSARSLFLDDTTGPLTYNPANHILACNVFNGNIFIPTSTTTLTFAGTTLTGNFGLASSMNGYRINITGTTNTINTLAFSGGVVNGVYTVTISNAGTGDLTIAGTFSPSSTYLTTDNTTLTIATGGKALMILRYINFQTGGNIYVIDTTQLF